MKHNNWTYQGIEIEHVEQFQEGTYGFIYEIEHIPTRKKYIGKKALHSNRTLPPLKGTKRKRHVTKESDWKTYHSSNDEIKAAVKEGKALEFKRTILQIVPTRKLETYYELKWLFIKGVIEPGNDYYNNNISGHFYRRDFLAENTSSDEESLGDLKDNS